MQLPGIPVPGPGLTVNETVPIGTVLPALAISLTTALHEVAEPTVTEPGVHVTAVLVGFPLTTAIVGEKPFSCIWLGSTDPIALATTLTTKFPVLV